MKPGEIRVLVAALRVLRERADALEDDGPLARGLHDLGWELVFPGGPVQAKNAARRLGLTPERAALLSEYELREHWQFGVRYAHRLVRARDFDERGSDESAAEGLHADRSAVAGGAGAAE